MQGRRYRFRKPARLCNLPTPPEPWSFPAPRNNVNALLSISAQRYHRGERTDTVYMPRQQVREKERESARIHWVEDANSRTPVFVCSLLCKHNATTRAVFRTASLLDTVSSNNHSAAATCQPGDPGRLLCFRVFNVSGRASSHSALGVC